MKYSARRRVLHVTHRTDLRTTQDCAVYKVTELPVHADPMCKVSHILCLKSCNLVICASNIVMLVWDGLMSPSKQFSAFEQSNNLRKRHSPPPFPSYIGMWAQYIDREVHDYLGCEESQVRQ